jgi:hypothetical protein
MISWVFLHMVTLLWNPLSQEGRVFLYMIYDDVGRGLYM